MGEGDGKLETLLTAPFTFANGGAGQDVRRPGPPAMPGRRWTWIPTQRAGILTQSAFLASHGREGSARPSSAASPSASSCCAWSCRRRRPGADALLPPPSPTKTTRDRLEQHRLNPECASCHNLMDMLGYGFESFDEMGRFRTTENNIKHRRLG